ncbi:cell division protein ZapA [Methylobacter sp.]|jgi:cell division protein ZapA|uniref:cell division protein ZapA n=1 Tax=Methylobacter sp. TaxID=2051955 RepID=UPI003DA684C0
MKKNPQPVSLTIMGKDYKIACDPDEKNDLIDSAQELDKKMRKIRDSGRVSGADRIAVMAALNLAHELRAMKNQNAMLTQSLNESLANMSHKIENVLENPETR